MSSTDPTPYGSGAHGHLFPEIDPGIKEAIASRFNDDNRFFPGHLGIRVVDVKRAMRSLRWTTVRI